MRVTSFLFPRIHWKNVRFLIACGALGALIAGIYGIIHDQITYSLSESYFSEFKFHQFADSDPRPLFPPDFAYGDRIFVVVIGFLATWWVGLFCGWFLGRASILPSGEHPTVLQIARHFAVIIGTAVVFGSVGYLWGTWRPEFMADFSPDFVLVGKIHNFGYLGALAGLITTLIFVRRARKTALENSEDAIANSE